MDELDTKYIGITSADLNKKRKIVIYAIVAILFLIFIYSLFLSAPKDLLPGTVIEITPGMSLRSASSVLEEKNIIRSRLAFEFFMIILGGEHHIVSADYLFEKKLSVWDVARRIETGAHQTAPVSVTIPEGFDVNQIAETFTSELKNFNQTKFLSLSKDKEGYLFPDTYFFLTNANEEIVFKSMSDNFIKKTSQLFHDFFSLNKNTNKTEKDIITMASIVEKEAKGDADRAIISGILWRRISIGMPLQVDAAPITYKTKGLPKDPICNPGLEAIKASMNPQSSPYLYYLHDKNGITHYAKTFSEHHANIEKYLK